MSSSFSSVSCFKIGKSSANSKVPPLLSFLLFLSFGFLKIKYADAPIIAAPITEIITISKPLLLLFFLISGAKIALVVVVEDASKSFLITVIL